METAVKTPPTVLVVDDDEDMLILMQLTLIKDGYNPIFSPNAYNLMAILAERQPDLVLLDINMVGANGAEICREIKSNPTVSAIPIVIYSANDDIEEVTRDCGADAYLAKPFVPDKLKLIFEKVFKADS